MDRYRYELPMTPAEKTQRRHSRKTRATKRAKRQRKANVQAVIARTRTPFTWRAVPGRRGLFERVHPLR